jgi:flavodoxin
MAAKREAYLQDRSDGVEALMAGKEKDMSRRKALGGPVALALGAVGEACAAEGSRRGQGRSRTLVAYFTRSGNTRVIAAQLHRELGADLFEIAPARPYPEDYEQTVAQATRERDARFAPPLMAKVANLAAYDTIFLGFPIWGETAPPVVRSFLKTHDLSGKTVRPFVTHGGYGLGDSVSVLRGHAPGARLAQPFSMEADQERRTMTQVRAWLAASQAG